MPNYPDAPDDTKTDTDSVGSTATTPKKKIEALEACLVKFWNGADIGKLERLDDSQTNWHGWLMWKKPQPAPNANANPSP